MANICSLALVVYAVCFSVLIPQATSQSFLFPEAQSTILPDPSTFFAPNLLSSPLPTNSFFQNFVLNNGDQPEYIHPYTMKSSNSSLSLAYPSFSYTSTVISTTPFQPDLTISGSKTTTIPDPNNDHHVVSDFNDLSVTLDFPSSNLRFFLIRGSPYLTCIVSQPTPVSISTSHTIVSSSSASGSNTKFIIKLGNGQTWLIYTSSPTDLTASGASSLTFNNFSGNIRVAVMPDANPKSEAILDQFSSSYPTSGAAVLKNSNTLTYKWEKTGGDLLILAHPLHLMLLSNATVLQDFKYKSIDGNLVGVVGDTWVLNSKPIPVTWNSIGGVKIDLFPEIISALRRDVDALSSTELSAASYFYGKLVAKAARLALIAEEVACPDVIPAIRTFLTEKIQPWLDGTFSGNGFLHDKKWGGLVTKQGSTDKGADFGFGLYSDHHYHLGYFVYGISVLAKIDPAWGEKYKAQAYSLLADYLNKDKQSNPNYTRLRCFDLYKLHSWAGGVTEFADGRNQESTSEAVNAYYAAALMGKAYNDPQLEATGSLFTTLEIQAAQMWWHVREGGENQTYEQDFAKENRVVGVLWSTKRDSGLWFAAAEAKEIRLGIQVMPISPITEVLFSDTGFPSELVNWALPALGRTGVTEAWKGFVYALQGLYDKAGALEKIKSLTGFDDGNSLSNLLWWIHSRS
ncbi:endo-1,3(4)-beta-glucanase 1-like [Pyrus ussuriensis x Pyrus communis]|uniref:glucan endo-1,3-beta-D-glucosidase n=1 Tax=Pyrus ussuriensis x Pyrus communis TaxID=2448454 RepID=A0A5N5G9N6_9ROSA|nr:endo-1,3(4)-beta-glucanase 1-like [Pyrus ussuriensis x Pyrus communis]